MNTHEYTSSTGSRGTSTPRKQRQQPFWRGQVATTDERMVKVRTGGQAFIQAAALQGHGSHAYCAIGYDSASNCILAWATDNNHINVKAVPVELIDTQYMYYK